LGRFVPQPLPASLQGRDRDLAVVRPRQEGAIDNNLRIRQARPGDEGAVVALVQELAATGGWHTPLTEEYARAYLGAPDCGALLAETEGRPCGLLSYSVRPNLFHAGDTALIEELVVHKPDRSRGVAHALMDAFLQAMAARGCVEVSVSTMPDNERAQRFYRAHGFGDEALLLERHLE
jgi:ribosomal protein S18 acetylase RimI-like enzyme